MNKIAATHKYLAFSLGGEHFGAPVLQVREIVRLMPVTPVPQMPAYVKGVINLRGRIITVVDMRVKLGIAVNEDTERNCIVVCQVDGGNKASNFVGVIVDTVDEVMSIKPDDIQERVSINAGSEADYVLGMTHFGGQVRTIMDMQQFLQAITALPHAITLDPAAAGGVSA